MLKLTQELFGPQDPELARVRDALSPEQLSGHDRLRGHHRLLRLLPQDHRGPPRQPERRSRHRHRQRKIDGDHAAADFMSYYIIVATAGHDTTSSSTAGAIWALAENPAEFAKVKADPR